jgi:effector-binding domain-containing protein
MNLTEPAVVDVSEQHVLQIRRTSPMSELPTFFHDALRRLGAFATEHRVPFAGPPMGITRSTPTATIDMAAAFPVTQAQLGEGDVAPAVLPSGRAATAVLTGGNDEIAAAYVALREWITRNGESPGQLAWEQYLTMPEPDGDPSKNVTQLWWLLA